MHLQVDIYQCGSKHIHVVLGGDAEGMAAFGDYDVFAKFVEACQEFVKGHAQIPEAFLDAFDHESDA